MPPRLSADALAFFRAQGKKGGKIGGKRAAALLSPDERKARASKGGRAAAVARTKKATAQKRVTTPINYSDSPPMSDAQLAVMRRAGPGGVLARTKKTRAKAKR